jgi:Protein involved in formate dehydrogenase formation
VPRWAAERILPAVVVATETAGPSALRRAVTAARADALAGWLAGADLEPVDRFVARASLRPVLEALGERAGAACAPQRNGGPGDRCPRCGGAPQLSWLAASGESLVSGPRNLLCARCGASWTCARSVCPACGEREEARLTVLAEQFSGPVSANGNGGGDERPVLPHLRVAGCSTCRRYLIEVDMARDARAIPEVDELVALPLDLHAADEGLTKLTPNLMGF